MNLAIGGVPEVKMSEIILFGLEKPVVVSGLKNYILSGLGSFWRMLQVLGLTTTWTHESLSRSKSLVSTVAICLAPGKPEGFLPLESGSKVSYHFFFTMEIKR